MEGFLEMRTAAEFKKAAFGVKQSGFYVDPDTSKNREIDVEAWLPDFLGLVRVGFIVECKPTTKPCVLLSSQDTVSDNGRHNANAMEFSSRSRNGVRLHLLLGLLRVPRTGKLAEDCDGVVGTR
jgi:hypothetical protein